MVKYCFGHRQKNEGPGIVFFLLAAIWYTQC